ncbi:hypothetical protein CC86DRAFT_138810 [Ophiobolus disseminans]|uniref:Uncharacterized protein n=1 Tax=Ophiobolus disseminans TaxID=1469910 RepID=A0A6A7ADK8_9PLEO|nr:hypothetical protein CC86DRAFT_138810 [Ophiobolus disseminans]
MKLFIIITAFALAAASDAQLNAREVEELVARFIDAKTMDPARLSVLSVLKTAIPPGPDFPRPTGGFEPEWYSKLPADVKSLLPKLYPAPVVAASANVSVSASTTSNSTTAMPTCVTSTITKTLHHVSAGTAAANRSSTSNGTIATATPSPTGYISTGSKTAMTMEVLAALAWVGLGAGFFYFA